MKFYRYGLPIFVAISIASSGAAPVHAQGLREGTGQHETPGAQQCESDPIFFAYYRTWRDKAIQQNPSDKPDRENKIEMTDIPKSVNMLALFHAGSDHYQSDVEFWNTFKNKYQPELKNAVRVLFVQFLLQSY